MDSAHGGVLRLSYSAALDGGQSVLTVGGFRTGGLRISAHSAASAVSTAAVSVVSAHGEVLRLSYSAAIDGGQTVFTVGGFRTGGLLISAAFGCFGRGYSGGFGGFGAWWSSAALVFGS